MQLLSVELEASADCAQLQRALGAAEAVASEALEGLDALRRFAAQQLSALEQMLERKLEEVMHIVEKGPAKQERYM